MLFLFKCIDNVFLNEVGIPSKEKLCGKLNGHKILLVLPVQPKEALSQEMYKRDSRLRVMRGTGFSWFGVMLLRSTGQLGCRVNHSCIHPEQKACSHCGAWKKIKSLNIFISHKSRQEWGCCVPLPYVNIPNKQCSIEISFETSKTEQFFVLDSHFYYLFQCQFVWQIFIPISPKHFCQSLSNGLALFRTLKRWLKSWFFPKRIPISHQTEPTMHVLSCLRSYVNLVIDVIIFRKCRPKEKSCRPWICTA